MTLAPITEAATVVQIHAAVAIVALGLGAIQLLRPKGDRSHKVIGWIWALLIAAVAVSSLWISGERFRFGPFSWIHGLSVLTLIALPVGLIHARSHRVRSHRTTMTSLFVGALVIAGLFTLAPGRIMGRAIFGG